MADEGVRRGDDEEAVNVFRNGNPSSTAQEKPRLSMSGMVGKSECLGMPQRGQMRRASNKFDYRMEPPPVHANRRINARASWIVRPNFPMVYSLE
jgi:hypothetical protein